MGCALSCDGAASADPGFVGVGGDGTAVISGIDHYRGQGPPGVAIDSSGNILVTTTEWINEGSREARSIGKVVSYAAGSNIGTVIVSGIDHYSGQEPPGVAIDSSGNILVTATEIIGQGTREIRSIGKVVSYGATCGFRVYR